MSKLNSFLIFGCGGHSRSVADVILFNTPGAQLFFVDEYAKPNEKILGFKLFKKPPAIDMQTIVAVGDNIQRKKLLESLRESQKIIKVVSRDVYIGARAKIKAGSFIAHRAHIGPLARIGKGVIVNTQAVLDHEVIVNDYSQIAPNVSVGGRTVIGKNVFIGIGAVIIDRLNIADNVIVGANATVVRDITEPGTYVGTPAVRIK